MRMSDLMQPIATRTDGVLSNLDSNEGERSDAGGFVALFGKLSAPGPGPATDDPAVVAEPQGAGSTPAAVLEALIANLDLGIPDGERKASPSTGDKADDSTLAGGTLEAIGNSAVAVLGALIAKPETGQDSALRSAGAQVGQDPFRALGRPQAEPLLAGNRPAPLKVMVQGQETHFKPVVEGFVSRPLLPLNGGHQTGSMPVLGDAAALVQTGSPSLDQSRKPKVLPVPAGTVVLSDAGGSSPEQVIGNPQEAPKPQQETLRHSMSAQRQSQAEGAANGDAQGKADADAGFAPAMFQKISGAILDEAKQLTELSDPSHLDPSAPTFISTAKASESAVRKLSIQLHPADLGLMTIRMKLSGDSLEMDVSVASEEVAQMLRRDSESLSSLLRGSGYRPDVINIHVGGSTQAQDGGFQEPRQQSHQHSFEQGAKQGDRSPNRNAMYENEGMSGEKDNRSDDDHSRRSVGGVYL